MIDLFSKDQPSLFAKKVYIDTSEDKEKANWEDCISSNDLMNITLGELVRGEKRVIVVCEIEKKDFYIVMSDKDYKAVSEKHPKSAVIHAGQLINIAKKRIDCDDYIKGLPSVMIAMDVFKGAKVV